jgi:hypothetical protein
MIRLRRLALLLLTLSGAVEDWDRYLALLHLVKLDGGAALQLPIAFVIIVKF